MVMERETRFWGKNSRLFALFLLQVTTLLAVKKGSLLDAYHQSPVVAYKKLLGNEFSGRDRSDAVSYLRHQSGDHSFDGIGCIDPQDDSALALQRQAHRCWREGNNQEAKHLFQEASRLLLSLGRSAEAAFCFYFEGEIWAEEEAYRRSLDLIQSGLEITSNHQLMSLRALLLQSRGFSLWYLDRLPASIEAFNLSLEIWQRTRFADGQVASWNNLASLYEELGVWERAEDCYVHALSLLSARAAKPIRYQLLLNFAVFSYRRGNTDRARRFLNLSRSLSHLSPFEYALASQEIIGTGLDSPDLVSPQSPSQQTEVYLRRGRYAARLGAYREAERALIKGLNLSREKELHFFSRKIAYELAKVRESQGLLQSAIDLYRKSLIQEDLLFNLDAVFPFSGAVSPSFDGWIRCLIQQGKQAEARTQIFRMVDLRQAKVKTFLEESLVPFIGQIEPKTLLAWNRLTSRKVPPGKRPKTGKLTLPPDVTLIELWPDGNKIFVWIDGPQPTHFRQIELPGAISELAQRICTPMSRTGWSLPAPPSDSDLRLVSSELLQQIEPWLTTERLLIVPHKELQSWPFELLQLSTGQLLSEEHILSYSPARSDFFRHNSVPIQPKLVLPFSFRHRNGAQKEWDFFRSLAISPQPVLRLNHLREPLRGRWIHLSSHFRLDKRSWILSSLEDGSGDLGLVELLEAGLDCELLTLAVCDAANTTLPATSYGLGISELFLLNGAQSLILSRWAVDERCVEIFLNTYQNIFNGKTIDESLAIARRNYLRRHKDHRGLGHPFFWSGLMYVGWPGKRISGSLPGNTVAAPRELVFFVLLVAAVWRAFARD